MFRFLAKLFSGFRAARPRLEWTKGNPDPRIVFGNPAAKWPRNEKHFSLAISKYHFPELARRLRITEPELQSFTPSYREVRIPKRTGGTRLLHIPDDATKSLQRRILRGLLAKLRSHPAAHGFERGRSIVTNALPHAHQLVVIKLDIRNFFGSTRPDRVRQFFLNIGWDEPCADLLTRLTTHANGLPQGAPTSPRLANLVNRGMDEMIARRLGKRVAYTRYADDITLSFSFHRTKKTGRTGQFARGMIDNVERILLLNGYLMHKSRKRKILRQHQPQIVTGLMVNERPNLPRKRRRLLRAAEHHLATNRPATLTPAQLAGWRALQDMIVSQSTPPP